MEERYKKLAVDITFGAEWSSMTRAEVGSKPLYAISGDMIIDEGEQAS
jgi:hypothetical protein